MTANNRLSDVLKSKGISKKDFAAQVGTSQQYISGICSGKLTVSIKQLSKFAELLKIPVSDLLVQPKGTDIFICPHCGMPIRVSKIEGEE